MRFIAAGWEGKLVLCVVFLDEILDDGAGFPEGEVGVRVVDRGHAAIRVDREEFRLLKIREWGVDEIVWQPKLFA